MKGLSILLTVFLFVAAGKLASALKQARVSPADREEMAAEASFTNGFVRFARYEGRRSASSQFTE